MKTRSSFALVLALVVGALPALAGVCNLRCASGQVSVRRSVVQDRATESAAGSGSGMKSCPLHSADPSGSEPARSSSRPCHGQPSEGSGAILVAVPAAPSPLTSSGSPGIETSVVAALARVDANSLRWYETGYRRIPQLSPLRSILRL